MCAGSISRLGKKGFVEAAELRFVITAAAVGLVSGAHRSIGGPVQLNGT